MLRQKTPPEPENCMCIYVFCGLAQCRRHTHRPFVLLLFCSAMKSRSLKKHPHWIKLALKEFLKWSLWLMNVFRHFLLRDPYFCNPCMKPCKNQHDFHIIIMKKAGNNIVQCIWDSHHILKIQKNNTRKHWIFCMFFHLQYELMVYISNVIICIIWKTYPSILSTVHWSVGFKSLNIVFSDSFTHSTAVLTESLLSFSSASVVSGKAFSGIWEWEDITVEQILCKKM